MQPEKIVDVFVFEKKMSPVVAALSSLVQQFNQFMSFTPKYGQLVIIASLNF